MTASFDSRGDAFPWPAALYALGLGGADRIGVFRRSPSVKLYRRILARHVRPGMRVVDLGCGYAIGACHLAAVGGQDLAYLGVDGDPGVCTRAREVLARLPSDRVRGEVVHAEAHAFLAASPRRFDLVLCNHSVHGCLPAAADSLRALGREVAARLDPDGRLIVADAFFHEGATPQEIERIKDYAARAAARLCTGAYQPPGPLLPAQVESALLGAGLRLLEGDDAPWFALGAYEGLQQARYVLRVFGQPANAAR